MTLENTPGMRNLFKNSIKFRQFISLRIFELKMKYAKNFHLILNSEFYLHDFQCDEINSIDSRCDYITYPTHPQPQSSYHRIGH